MGLLKRFWSMIKSQLNYLVGKAENPEKMLNQILLDMQEHLITAKREVAISIADEKRLKRQFEEENSAAINWEKRAVLAIRSGQESLAKQALERKSEHDKMAGGFEKQWKSQKKSVEILKKSLDNLSNKISDAKRRKNLLVARAKRAKAQKTISVTMSGVSENSTLDSLQRMEDSINKLEAEASATAELAEEASVDELEKKISALSLGQHDDALEQLKAKVGITKAKKITQQDMQTIRTIEKEIEVEMEAKKNINIK